HAGWCPGPVLGVAQMRPEVRSDGIERLDAPGTHLREGEHQRVAKVFPGIFQPLDAMSRDLRAHLRYPEDLFRVQTDLNATYNMSEPEIYYHREDQWQKPVLSRPNERPDPFLPHIVTRLPEEWPAEFIPM